MAQKLYDRLLSKYTPQCGKCTLACPTKIMTLKH